MLLKLVWAVKANVDQLVTFKDQHQMCNFKWKTDFKEKNFIFFVVLQLANYFSFFSLLNEPGLGCTGIDSGMIFTPFTSRIGEIRTNYLTNLTMGILPFVSFFRFAFWLVSMVYLFATTDVQWANDVQRCPGCQSVPDILFWDISKPYAEI